MWVRRALATAGGAAMVMRRCADASECRRRADVSDVAVIGGGIVGTSVARELSQCGAAVTLLERGSCGCEASGLSAGTIWNAGVPTCVTEANASYLLRAGSAEMLRKLGNCDFNESGALDLAATPAEAAYLRIVFEDCQRQGLRVEWVNGPEQLCALEPALAGGSALCGVHTPLSGSVQPALATRAMAAAAAAAGCTVVEDAECVSIEWHEEEGCHVIATSSGESFRATHVIVAAGAWAAPLMARIGVHLPVEPVKGVISTHPAPPNTLKKVIFDVASSLHFAQNGDGRDDATRTPAKCTFDTSGRKLCRKLYGKQCGASDDHMLVFGGDRLPGVASDDYQVPQASEEAVRLHASELLPAITRPRGAPPAGAAGAAAAQAAEEQAGAWAGLMPFSADGRPIVGDCAVLGAPPNLWLACGFGPSGIMEGPMAARLLARRVAQRLELDSELTADPEGAHEAMRAMDPCRPGCCVRIAVPRT